LTGPSKNFHDADAITIVMRNPLSVKKSLTQKSAPKGVRSIGGTSFILSDTLHAMMASDAAHEAGTILWRHWRAGTKIEALPDECRPRTRADGYAAQAEVARASGQEVSGWKIAATSVAGQRHIGVDGPLAGPLLADRRIEAGGVVPFVGNLMRVAEAEFAFRMARDLPPRDAPWTPDEAVAAAASLHPAIEIPDSRYLDFARAGAPQLIADTACACWFVIGGAVEADWRTADLAAHRVTAFSNGAQKGEGAGRNVLGDPRIALAWVANELNAIGRGLRAGEVVMTGTCVAPIAIAAGDRLTMDFGAFGSVGAKIGSGANF
jgi:2-keto-4-pentenoate hydratase